MNEAKDYSHYFKDVSNLDSVDVYRTLRLFNVTDPALAHAIKKLLVAGGRGAKDASQDVEEAIVSLKRYQEMQKEDLQPPLIYTAAQHEDGVDTATKMARINNILRAQATIKKARQKGRKKS